MVKARKKRSAVSIDSKIAKAKTKLEKARARCEKLEDEFRELLDKRDRLRMEQLSEAMKNSDRTFEEILNFIRK
ncbi:hypothetical protein SAMN05720764_1432 [Fibrobacter sp. UWH5]|uniref:hypothetical protein n=1 Tax=Fibrobacter sp. UWH5 TaxID=1896211 RepID=UPI0009145A06|nr:hypothetical protein [Fibrobacter sp. UWH5]SHL93387.1 hypothetical protein SAMN05720764_1432 [Fibrobacter sp. UWH5]